MFAAHPKRTLLVVGLFVVVAGVVGGPLAGRLESDGGFTAAGADSEVAEARLVAAAGREPNPGVVLLVEPGVAAGAERTLAGVDGIAVTGRGGRADGRVVLTGTLAADAEDDAVADDALTAFAGDRAVTVGGSAVGTLQINERVGADLGRAELLAFPILLLLSLVFFRGRAALMPLVVGVTTVLGAFLALAVVNAFYAVNVFALNLTIGLGLGLAIDYTLFLVSRFREELAAGTADPVAETLRRAGHTVLFSAVTVACALITLTLFPQGFLKSMGIAGALVALVAAAAALVISPALLALWDTKLARPGGDDPSTGRWYRLAHAVMRRPGRVAAVTALAMIALALPALSTTWSPIDASAIPRGDSARTVADALTTTGRPAEAPLLVAVDAPRSAGPVVRRLAADIRGLDGVTAVAAPRALDGATWQIDAVAAGSAAGPVAQRLVTEIRNLPTTVGVSVGGEAASFVDQQAAIGSRLLGAIALLVGLTLLVLFVMTGSVILPIKAVLMNALTVGAALAPLTLIYQHGRLEGLLGYTGNGGVEPTDFLVTAAIVFALSTDYGVFLLGRIKEARATSPSERDAVAAGLAATGRVVTAAAILLAVAIGAFSTSSISFIQQIGVAAAVGVLVDAFVVRTLLVPSLMALLGRWNWWAPRALQNRLPRTP